MKSAFDEMMKGLDDVEDFLAGEREGFRVHIPEQVDVRAIRQKLQMTQSTFSNTFGFSLDAVKHWEGGRRTPDLSARAYLTIIHKAPSLVMEILVPSIHRRPRLKTATGKQIGVISLKSKSIVKSRRDKLANA